MGFHLFDLGDHFYFFLRRFREWCGVNGGVREEEYEEEEEGEEEENEDGEEGEEEVVNRDGFFEGSFTTFRDCVLRLSLWFFDLLLCFLLTTSFCFFNTPKDDGLLDNGSIIEWVDRLVFSSSSEEE